uniref:Tetratricopeptide repeat protein n=1 Tax=Desertifilum tharense IPPAS B-1220 TaxID=1781255 RepID=A0ACD5GX01_9CYAN
MAIADILTQQQDYLLAIVAYRKLIELAPNNPQAYYRLGLALQTRERRLEAREALEKARDLFRAQNQADGVRQVEEALRRLR